MAVTVAAKAEGLVLMLPGLVAALASVELAFVPVAASVAVLAVTPLRADKGWVLSFSLGSLAGGHVSDRLRHLRRPRRQCLRSAGSGGRVGCGLCWCSSVMTLWRSCASAVACVPVGTGMFAVEPVSIC